MRNLLKRFLTAQALLAFAIASLAQNRSTLKKGFEEPPPSARPRVWWHWMNGNITKEGIRLDLEWMHRVGIAGFQNFDAALDTPQVVDKRLAYMTPEWKDAFKYAITLGNQFGMEMAIAGSPGWSETGGPWVPPAQGMKKYVWSETVIEANKPFRGKLVPPPSITGMFQSLPLYYLNQPPPGSKALPQYYADSVVVAYRRPKEDVDLQALHPKMSASSGAPNYALLADGDLETTTKLPIGENENAWIQYEFEKPQTVGAVSFVVREVDPFVQALGALNGADKLLEASDDGQHFVVVGKLPALINFLDTPSPEYTISFPEVTAKYFRFVFQRTPPPPLPDFAVGTDPASFGLAIPPAPTDYEIAELVLHGGARVNRWEEKAAFVPVLDLYSLPTPRVGPDQAIAKSEVVDLTARMHTDGTLDWTPPSGGDWVVLRFGYSLLGITNHPATAEATGLEVDKLDRRFVKQYFDTYLDSYKDAVGPDLIGAHGITYVINDSWEAGSQNWTDNMLEQFQKLRGYDAIPWLPVLTGRIVESAEASDRFLWDFRRTLADLVANEHYAQLETTLHERHLGHYGEAHEEGRALIADGMEIKKFNEIPMSAMWTQQALSVNNVQYGYNADDRESASVAHIYGQNIAAAESLTAAFAPWAWSPATLKPTADQELLNGINRFVIHESAHQPLVNSAPGLTLGPYGQWFNRNDTWAEQAGPWIDYLARSSYLLQQGRFAADVVYFYGEDSNLTAIFGNKAPDIPSGYGFDYINADALIHELKVINGHIATASGMEYKVLALDPYSRHMSLPVLAAIRTLVENGAVVAGAKPIDDPSLSDDQPEFEKLSSEMFGDGSGVHRLGKGTVYAGQNLNDVFSQLNLLPDFQCSGSDSHVEFVHRQLPVGDIYFLDNRSNHDASIDATFRVGGLKPELWRAETGTTEAVSFHVVDGRTTVPIHLEPWGTVFVVFAEKTSEHSHAFPATMEKTLITVTGPWNISFQAGRGAPASITTDRLLDWSQSTAKGVKYFSGIATYTKTLQAAGEWFGPEKRLWLDLGDVKNLAVVKVNGKTVGESWHAPYRLDVTAALKPGANEISVEVVNSWVNRLIGDEQPGATKLTFADVRPYKANSPPLPSGLLGPVTLVQIASQ